MNIKETIAIINEMRADSVIGQYAIGGAVGATFYIEPFFTKDLDVFVALEVPVGQSIITLLPIYEYLEARGCQVNEKGDIVIFGWPVQFLPVGGDPLLEEAFEQSVERDIDGIPARVFSAEHLAAIALKLGRPKDKLRLRQFLEFRALSEPVFSSILERHHLTDNWEQFKRQMVC